MKLNIAELDCIFISYDEPNAERNWSDLLNKAPWAKRSHGVKGSNACHKAAAMLSETEWFITVDADNIVDPEFFEQTVELPDNTNAVSWPGTNILNGLRYGNGSLKVWRKDFVLNMKTHEDSKEENGQVDFCWEEGYRPMIDSYSRSYPNATPYQAWRAGFREGVKMSLVDGVKSKEPDINKLHWHNLHRLKVWCSVGSHEENGVWAILGARHGCYKLNCTDWDYTEVRDFDKLEKIWLEVQNYNVTDLTVEYGVKLYKDYKLKTTYLDAETSEYVIKMIEDQYLQAVEQVGWITRRNRV